MPGELVRIEPDQESGMPAVVRPGIKHVDLVEWASHNLVLIENLLLEHGALLFRGFNQNASEDFERFATAICPDLFEDNGEHPRQNVSGNVYTPIFYPVCSRFACVDWFIRAIANSRQALTLDPFGLQVPFYVFSSFL